MGFVTIGIALGQGHDPTAIAVAELEWRQRADGRAEEVHQVRVLQRLPLEITYAVVAEHLTEVVRGVMVHSAFYPAIYASATDGGQPVAELLRTEGCSICPVYFSHGDQRTVNEDGSIAMGKRWLVHRLQALIQIDCLNLPITNETAAMKRELQEYQITADGAANEQRGAFKIGAHDDLVTAIGLAVQEAAFPHTFAVSGKFKMPRGATDDGVPTEGEEYQRRSNTSIREIW